MSRYTIDRFEGADWAILEDEQARVFNVPRQWLPPGTHEGDVVQVSKNTTEATMWSLRFEIDSASRNAQLVNARELRKRLLRGPKGDVSL